MGEYLLQPPHTMMANQGHLVSHEPAKNHANDSPLKLELATKPIDDKTDVLQKALNDSVTALNDSNMIHAEVIRISEEWKKIQDPTDVDRQGSQRVVQTTTNVEITTWTTEVAKIGSKTLQVHSTHDMRVGQKIRIGDVVYEEGVSNFLGSINLMAPLRLERPAGTTLTVMDETRNIPHAE